MDKLARKAAEGRLGTPKGRKAIRTRAPEGDNARTFDRSRNAEKRQADPAARREALADRMARRRRASWQRETRNLLMKAAVLGAA